MNGKVDDLISRQDAIDALCAVCGNDCDKSEFVYNAPQDEQVILCPEHYCLCTLPSVQPEPQWIPCSKELPKIGDRVMGTYKNSLFENGPYVVRVMHREKKYWVGDDEHWFLYENIIAWMPLPQYEDADD